MSGPTPYHATSTGSYQSLEDIMPNDPARYTRYTSLVKLDRTRDVLPLGPNRKEMAAKDLSPEQHRSHLLWTVKEVSQGHTTPAEDPNLHELQWKSTDEGARELAKLRGSKILISQSHWFTLIPSVVIKDRSGRVLRHIRIPVETIFSTMEARRKDIENPSQRRTENDEVSFIWSEEDDTRPGAWAVRHVKGVHEATGCMNRLYYFNDSRLVMIQLQKQMGPREKPVYLGTCTVMNSLVDVLTVDPLDLDGWSGLQYQSRDTVRTGRPTHTSSTENHETVILSGLKLFHPPEGQADTGCDRLSCS